MKATCVECGTEFERTCNKKTCGSLCAGIRQKAYKQRYGKQNADKIKEYNRKWRDENPDRRRETNRRSEEKRRDARKKWYAANREVVAERKKIYRTKTLAKHRERNRKWSQANPEKVKASKEKYRQRNRDRLRISGRAYGRDKYLIDPIACIAASKAWYSRHREEVCERQRAVGKLRRAAKHLGIPPILYVAMKLRDRLQSPETPE